MALDVMNCVFIRNGYSGIPYGASAGEAAAGYATFATDGGGVRGEGDDNRVTASRFESNDRGIFFEAGRGLQITGNHIRGSLQPGISLGRRRAGGPALVTDVTVRENAISNNLDVGIRVGAGLRVTVEGNTLAHNWNSGIIVLDGDSVTVRRNRIHENSRIDTNGRGSFEPEAFGGLAVMDPVGTVAILENEIQSNSPGLFTHTAGGIRLLMTRSAPVTLTGNTVFANEGDGILIQGIGTGVRVNTNNITGNRGFGINNFTVATINAERNWWASPTGPVRGAAAADNPEQVAGPLDTQPWAASPLAYPSIP